MIDLNYTLNPIICSIYCFEKENVVIIIEVEQLHVSILVIGLN